MRLILPAKIRLEVCQVDPKVSVGGLVVPFVPCLCRVTLPIRICYFCLNNSIAFSYLFLFLFLSWWSVRTIFLYAALGLLPNRAC